MATTRAPRINVIVRSAILATAAVLLFVVGLVAHDHRAGIDGAQDHCTVCSLAPAPPPDPPVLPTPCVALEVTPTGIGLVAPLLPIAPLAVAPKTSPPAPAA